MPITKPITRGITKELTSNPAKEQLSVFDDFTDTGDPELENHAISPLIGIGTPAWARTGLGGDVSLSVNTSNEVVIGADAVGTYAGYTFDAGFVASKIEAIVKNTTAGGGEAGFQLRRDGNTDLKGIYIRLANSGSDTTVSVRRWTTLGEIGSGTITGTNITTYQKVTVEDDGLGVTVYLNGETSNAVRVDTALDYGETQVGLYSEAAMNTAFWKELKVYR